MTTYKEYIALTLKRFDIDNSTIDLLLINQKQLIADCEKEVDVMIAKRALCNEFALLIPIWSQISESGSSVSLNFEAIKIWYEALCDELDIVPVTRIIVKDISSRW